jgi:hypothetical protein
VSTKQSSIWLLYTPWGRTENSLGLSSPPGCSNLHTSNLHATSSWVLVIFSIQPLWNDRCINCSSSQKIKLSIYLLSRNFVSTLLTVHVRGKRISVFQSNFLSFSLLLAFLIRFVHHFCISAFHYFAKTCETNPFFRYFTSPKCATFSHIFA